MTWTDTKPERTITEDAAIGVIALLLHDLEEFRIRRVLPIGGGGDYHLELEDGTVTQLECSGIYIDPDGHRSHDRLQTKLAQVLKQSADGFAAVATFSRTVTQEAHCFLHFVTTETFTPRKKRKKPKKKPGRKNKE